MNNDEYDYTVSKGTQADVQDIFDLATEFYAESNFKNKLTFDPAAWKRTIIENIDHPAAAAILARAKDGKLIGYVLIYMQTDYTVEPIGEMFQFYVHKDFRGTGLSRELIQAAVDQYKKWGCKRCYAEASPGMTDASHLKIFENLWGKFGYQRTGVTMMMEI